MNSIPPRPTHVRVRARSADCFLTSTQSISEKLGDLETDDSTSSSFRALDTREIDVFKRSRTTGLTFPVCSVTRPRSTREAHSRETRRTNAPRVRSECLKATQTSYQCSSHESCKRRGEFLARLSLSGDKKRTKFPESESFENKKGTRVHLF